MSPKRKEKVATYDNILFFLSIMSDIKESITKGGASANTSRNGFFLHRMWRTTSCVNERFDSVMRNGEPFVKSSGRNEYTSMVQ